MRKAAIKRLASGLMLAAIVGCSSPPQQQVISVTILGGDRSIALGDSAQLVAEVAASGGASEAVLWQSSASTVVQVDGTGRVLGLALGSATVSATSVFDGSTSGSIAVTVVLPTAPEAVWTRQFASSGGEVAEAVRFSPDGGVVVAGTTNGGNLGGVTALLTDAFVIRLHPDGTTDWVRQFGTAASDDAYGLAVDGEGNVFVGGSTHGDLQVVNAGLSDAYVRKYDPTGDIVWTRQFGTAGFDDTMALAAAADGSVVAVGNTRGDLEGTSAGGRDVFVRKYDADGVVLWTRQFGSTEFDGGWDVAVGGAGQIAVVGYAGGVIVGGSAGSTDAFVRLYDADGAVLWTRQFGTDGADYAEGVAIDAQGNVLVAGFTGGSLSGVHAGGDDAFVRKYDPTGSVLWTHQFGTTTIDHAYAVATDPAGDVFVAGYTFGVLVAPAEAGDHDAFLRKLTADGTVLWTLQVPMAGDDLVYAVDAAADGGTVIAGGTHGDFEGEPAVSSDLFVRRYGP